jgi:hypothetical protein
MQPGQQVPGQEMTYMEQCAALAAGQTVNGMHRCSLAPGTHSADHTRAGHQDTE